ncbi:DUF3856 domain-containing protein [Chlorobium ferrooxidans]|uniref:DUF3856 domain-containing protein n=1 Tax=Chlorobium ferrooxidans DSM 13031 TaxID=377431 RepID=Q0YNZ0_9CHLB|nr:DUF3856 domain-containing protein [Chlorobium ferrooxidans]EAT58017.1 conserved hypothetical protein [Chlorobium ferrooxidans DSM 13031]
MKPLQEVAMAYKALSDAERHYLDGAYEAAAESCRKAMEESGKIPDTEAFDHSGFEAFCHASLSAATGRLCRFEESLASADRALYYFNRRGELNQDDGKLWIKAVFSRAIALEGLGRSGEALGEFRKSGEMLAERKGEMPGRDELKQQIDSSIAKLQSSVPSKSKPGYKAWWEFWS